MASWINGEEGEGVGEFYNPFRGLRRSFSYQKMSTHKKSLSDDARGQSGRRRDPVFSSRSQRFERQGTSGTHVFSTSGPLYSSGELRGRGSSAFSGPIERSDVPRSSNFPRSSSQRPSNMSTMSESTLRELARAETTFDPSELLKEGLDEWHQKSVTMQLMKRSQSVSASRRRMFNLRNSVRVADFPDGQQQQQPEPPPDPHSDEEADILGKHHRQQQQHGWSGGSRHLLQFDFDNQDVRRNEDGSLVEVPKEYADTLSIAPPATLIHLVMLYHQALVQHGLNDEADKIADHLSRLQALGTEDPNLELMGIDLLLRDGLLQYLLQIQPYIPSIPSQVVKFKDVGFTTTVQVDTGYESIGTKLLGLLKGPFKKSVLEKVTMLNDLTGYLMPGSLTLVMGSPGSGNNVITNVLAGRANNPGATTVGSVTYNGRNVHDIKSRRLISIVTPQDIHMATLSVRETLEFARECSQYHKTRHFGEDLRRILGDVLNAGQDPKLEMNMSMMGLKRVADRPVGSPMMPSISEAERHKLSVAQAIAGTYAVYLFDHLNKGLDDTVTFDIVTSLWILARVRSLTVAVTLLQPAQDVFDLFDRIILLNQTQIVYQGPRQDALPYFEALGYLKPKQMSVPEFLEEVTTADGARFRHPSFPGLNVEGFTAAYKSSDHHKDVLRVVDSPENLENFWVQGSPPLGVNFTQRQAGKGSDTEEAFSTFVSGVSEGGSLVDPSMRQTLPVYQGDEVVAYGGSKGTINYLKVGDSDKGPLPAFEESEEDVRLQLQRPLPDEGNYGLQFSRDYVQDRWPEFLLLLRRDLKATWRYKLGLIIRLLQVLVLGFYVSFTFFRINPGAQQLNFNLIRSVFFVSLLDMTLFNLGQLPGLVQERELFYKESGANFYRSSSYTFAKLVGSLPASFAEATIWTVLVYFLTNLSLKDGSWHFWAFYVTILLSVLNGAALVRFIAAFAPDAVAANGMTGLMVAIFIVFAGFLIPHREVPDYWIWAYYLDPLQWGITSLIINEFTSSRYDTLCRDIDLMLLPPCRGRADDKIGHAYLESGQFYTGRHWIGISIVVMTGWFIVFNLLTLRAYANIRRIPNAIITPSAQAKILKKTESLVVRDVEMQGPVLSLAATPVTMSWHDLSYDIMIPSSSKSLSLLTYVSGWAEPGEMVGICGATGAGKSLLLNCLAGRGVEIKRIGGQILVNGYPRNLEAFAKVIGYADQLEAYSPYMTVYEAIAFGCEMQLGKTTTLGQRQRFVREIVGLLELKTVANTLVKSLGASYLTSAEAMRLRLGTELARNPSVLFIDQPTKNLDARTALQLTKMCRRIADSGRIVFVATAMPSQRVLTYFTSLQILKRGGETVYWGPVGKNGDMVKAYFESIPGTPKCPPNTSVVNYAIDTIGDGVKERQGLKDYAFEYRVHELALHNHVESQRLRRGKGMLGSELSDTSVGSSYGARASNIFIKMQLYYWRNVAYSWARCFSGILMALLLGTIYLQVDSNTTPRLSVKAGSIFISSLLLALSNAQAVIPQVLSNRKDTDRETNARQYNVFLYSVGWTSGEVPYLAVSTLLYAVIFCSMVDIAFQSASAFFRYWFILFELALAITAFGMLLASVAVLPQIAGTLVTLFTGFWVATSGLVVPKKKILPAFLWIFWTNPLQYALSALTSIAFFCDVNKTECLDSGRNLLCATDPSSCPRCNCPRLEDTPNGASFVWTTLKNNRSLNHDSVRLYMFVLFLFIVIFRFSTFMVWRIHVKKLKTKIR